MKLSDDEFIYRIPLIQRATHTTPCGCKEKALECDGVGFFVRYNKEEDIIPVTKMRNYLMGRSDTWCFVVDKSLSAAIGQFYREWEGAKVGGDTEESKALWINKRQPIIKYPKCDMLHLHTKKTGHIEFLCGEPEEVSESEDYVNGQCGMCILSGYDCMRMDDGEDNFDEYPLEKKLLPIMHWNRCSPDYIKEYVTKGRYNDFTIVYPKGLEEYYAEDVSLPLRFPRYKVISDYPDNPYSLNETVTLSCYENAEFYIEKGDKKLNAKHFDLYTNIFRKMQWWEERTLEQMPQYVKKIVSEGYHRENDILQVCQWIIIPNKLTNSNKNSYWGAVITASHTYIASSLHPSTEIEMIKFKEKEKQRMNKLFEKEK